MWVFLNDAFLSIVSKDCGKDQLLVRARRPRDIQRIFPTARVTRCTTSDYLYRAVVAKVDVALALANVIADIDYSNFKNSVDDKRLHDAYLHVWMDMSAIQPSRPYSGTGWHLPELRHR